MQNPFSILHPRWSRLCALRVLLYVNIVPFPFWLESLSAENNRVKALISGALGDILHGQSVRNRSGFLLGK